MYVFVLTPDRHFDAFFDSDWNKKNKSNFGFQLRLRPPPEVTLRIS